MMDNVTDCNYELWLLRYAEGDLGAEECAAVEAWLANHPEAAEELALYCEAPRLERDESVRFSATVQQSAESRSLWPVVVRWSAAGAVIAALMLPAMRMGSLGPLPEQEGSPHLVAEAAPPAAAAKQVRAIKATEATETIETIETEERIETIETEGRIETVEAIDTMVRIVPAAPVSSSSLIAFEAESEPLQSHSLIAYEPDDWGDRLLALNDATHSTLAQSAGGRLVSRLLPDNDQLSEHVVVPLREGLSNLKNNLKKQ